MSHLSDQTRADAVGRLRRAADLLAEGRELEAGKMILAGLHPVALDLKRVYGPMVRMIVNSWVRATLDEKPPGTPP